MAGKQYTSAKLLYNADGDPIPQFLDVSDTTDSPQGTFKPITSKSDVSVTNFPTTQNVQLTGSNVVEVLNEQITTKLFDVKQIRDTSRHISALSNVIGENKKIVVMYNKHDAEVKVSIVGLSLIHI